MTICGRNSVNGGLWVIHCFVVAAAVLLAGHCAEVRKCYTAYNMIFYKEDFNASISLTPCASSETQCFKTFSVLSHQTFRFGCEPCSRDREMGRECKACSADGCNNPESSIDKEKTFTQVRALSPCRNAYAKRAGEPEKEIYCTGTQPCRSLTYVDEMLNSTVTYKGCEDECKLLSNGKTDPSGKPAVCSISCPTDKPDCKAGKPPDTGAIPSTASGGGTKPVTPSGGGGGAGDPSTTGGPSTSPAPGAIPSTASGGDGPLRLKIIVTSYYDLMLKDQNSNLSYVDKVSVPMDQFGISGEGYKDSVVIMCHMTGNPYGYDLELVYEDQTSPSDVPELIKRCDGMKSVQNIVYCALSSFRRYANYKWQCRAKQKNPNNDAVIEYAKRLEFTKVESKVKVRLNYFKWYGYDERGLRFRLHRGSQARIQCDAGYYQNGRLEEIPFPYEYSFKIFGQEGLPQYAKQEANVLTLSEIPQNLDDKEIICFVVPRNKSDIATYGVGQRFFRVAIFTTPERPSILVTMKDNVDASQIIRNPSVVATTKGGSATELTCTLQNFDAAVDRNTWDQRYLDWVKCKNYECEYDEANKGTATRVSGMTKRLEGNKATLVVQTNTVTNSGIFMCVAVRPYVNQLSENALQKATVVTKVLVETKPGEKDGSTKYGRMKITKTAAGDLEFRCLFTGYPFPDLEITRRDTDNVDVRLENPKWTREFEGNYFDNMSSDTYGSELRYKLPKENIGADKARGIYVCTAENSLGKAETDAIWDDSMMMAVYRGL